MTVTAVSHQCRYSATSATNGAIWHKVESGSDHECHNTLEGCGKWALRPLTAPWIGCLQHIACLHLLA